MATSVVDSRLRVLDEGGVLIHEAFRAVTGRKCHPQGALRWGIVGVRGIRLETVKVAGRRLTSVLAMRRWLARLQDDPLPPAATMDVAAADKVLESFGLGREG